MKSSHTTGVIHFVIAFGIVAGLMFGVTDRVFAQDDWDEEGEAPVEIHGFVEGAMGGRVVDDPSTPDDALLNEARFRLDLAHYLDRTELYFKGDFVADGVSDDTRVDIRRAAVLLRLADWLDVVAGRQVLTWGTGDLVFLNDLFAKDFVSFFVGRDDEFLKAPSNSLKATVYTAAANLDFVWTPTFTSDEFINGERLSFNRPPAPDSLASMPASPIVASYPDGSWENGEFAARLYRRLKGYELAAYAYAGFWKQPTAIDTTTMMPTFAELTVFGASARGNLLGGIANVEGAYYDSREDADGSDPLRPNSQARGLVGYERELFSNFTTGLQYYGEWTVDYDSLVANLPDGYPVPDDARHLVTVRLTHRLMRQTLSLSLFGFYSPNDEDGHIRLAATRDWNDTVALTIGANVMWGDSDSFFGQLEDNSNAYLRVRASF